MTYRDKLVVNTFLPVAKADLQKYFENKFDDLNFEDKPELVKAWKECSSRLRTEVFGEDYFIGSRDNASEYLGELAFEAIGYVKKYEEKHYGMVCTDFSEPQIVLKELMYIFSEVAVEEFLDNLTV